MQPDLTVNILLVDDHPENLLALECILEPLGENLVRANSGEEALRCLLNQDFAVILLDVQMPGMSGFETAALIRSRARSREIPIIFLTAFSTSDDLMFKGYSLGAVDYLHKPIDPIILSSKVAVFVDLFRKTELLKRQTIQMQLQASQLRAANAELRQSEERFRQLSACSPVGIFLLDTDGYCTYTNPRCQEICGFDSNGGLGEQWQQALHPDDQKRAIVDWQGYVEEKVEMSYEYRFLRPDGSLRWTHVRSAPLFSDQGNLIGHVGTIEDITERKLSEAVQKQMMEEQAARREAEAANRMKDEFLAVLSHELRTPLNSILGWSRLLRTRQFDAETMERALETIERNAALQSQLIEDILDVSKIIRGQLRLSAVPLNLSAVLRAAETAVRPQAEQKEIQLETVLGAEEVSLVGDPVRLHQVVWNLLTNAIKFTPSGGQVRMQLKLAEVAIADGEESAVLNSAGWHQTPPSLESVQSDGASPPAGRTSFAYVTISDTGVGISPEFLPYVFDRFRQADSTTTRSHAGLGLGLAIVRHLVELHGGRVWAESAGEGAGATFTVALPLRDPTSLSDSTERSESIESEASLHSSEPTPSPNSPESTALLEHFSDSNNLEAAIQSGGGASRNTLTAD